MEASTVHVMMRDWMKQWFAQHPASSKDLLALTQNVLDACAEDAGPWQEIPTIIHAHLGARGYRWNGIYVLRDGDLLLGPAAGPPVCNHLPASPGLFRGGMCHDAILMNQTLAASDVKLWPGYVSCDHESGLQTRAGLVVPLRNAQARPIAVWDLDCTEDLHADDPAYFDALFASLSRFFCPTTDDFLAT